MSATLGARHQRVARGRHQPSGPEAPTADIHVSTDEWYRWKNNLRTNSDIKILLSIDPASFPLGTGPKQYEIWHDGYYPVVWTNKKFRMMYVNMGHNDMDYEHKFDKTNKTLSFTFDNGCKTD